MSSSIELDSSIPSGSWTLYFHSPEQNKWDISTFTKIATVSTWREWFSVIEQLGLRTIGEGMFFLMRDPIPPLWENSKNIRGGNYSFRTQRTEAGDSFVNTSIACMINKIMKDEENKVHGLSISPKKGFNIIKVWNIDSTKYKNVNDINLCWEGVKYEDLLYTPFLAKKM